MNYFIISYSYQTDEALFGFGDMTMCIKDIYPSSEQIRNFIKKDLGALGFSIMNIIRVSKKEFQAFTKKT